MRSEFTTDIFVSSWSYTSMVGCKSNPKDKVDGAETKYGTIV